MLCCLVGGVLVAALRKSARRGGTARHAPLLVVVFALATGMLAFELIVSILDPLGVVHSPGPLATRLAFVVVPGIVAVLAARLGAGPALLGQGAVFVAGLAASGGAFAAEALDLHVLELHAYSGLAAGVVVHAPALIFVAAGMWLHLKATAACPCPAEPVVLTVPSLGCENCCTAVRRRLTALDGVETVRFDLPSRTVQVEGMPTEADVRSVLTDTGRPVG